MPRTITLGAAQTGPVNEDDWRPNVRGACAMIEEAGRRKVDIRVALRRVTGWPAVNISRQTCVQWLAILAAMVIDSTLLIAAVLIGVLALLVFFPFDKL
jgi:hypothetical protein